MELLGNFARETLRLFIEMSPYLLLGFFFAGLLHTLLGEKYIRRHFARSGWVSIIKAAIFGIPLPVCSCAVIPLAESLRRDGASKSATMAFLVSTPSSGVDSILATYALMGPIYALFRPIASFFSGVLVGIITHFMDDEKEETPAAQLSKSKPRNCSNTKTAPGIKSKKGLVKEILVYGFNVIPEEIFKTLLVGVVIGGAISSLVPADFGAKYLLGSPLLNYVMILLISIPLYVCATGSIPIAAALIAKGVLPGAALAFLIAGPATNSVTIAFVYKKMGKQVAFFYILSIIVASVVLGVLLDALVASGVMGIGAVIAGEEAQLPEFIKISCAIIMAFLFLNSKYDLIGLSLFHRRNNMTNKTIHTIHVPDMTCQHCKMRITKALEQMPEIQSVSIDLNNKDVTVETDASREIIVNRIKEEGYSPV